MRGPNGRWRDFGLIHEGTARREAKKKQGGTEGALAESHPAADPAAENGDGEPETTG